MSLYEIVESLQNAQGNLNKQAILMQHKDNPLLKEYMRVVNSPAINMYQRKITECGQDLGSQYEFTEDTLSGLVYHLAERQITGKQAEKWLSELTAAANEEGKELIKYVIDRSIGASVGDTLVLKTWPYLYFVPSYMRCSLLNDKTRKHFPDGKLFITQLKADGLYCSLYTNGEGYTRQGSKFPSWLVGALLRGADYSRANPQVLLGEVLVSNRFSGDVLSRQEGNGLINSALKGADPSDFVEYDFCIECWDMLSVEDFEAGSCSKPYNERLKELTSRVEWEFENAMVIPTYYVKSLEEAYAINNGFLLEGLEGSVVKTMNHSWKSGTSPHTVKLKVSFEIDLEITGVAEGSGKAAGMAGALQLKSSCGNLVTDVGTGMPDALRKSLWKNKEELIGTIVAVKANDIISKRDRDTKSLFLPVFLECRVDKTEADSLEQCEKILSAAKGLK